MRDPVVVLASGGLLVACLAWAVWGTPFLFVWDRETGGFYPLLAIATEGTAAVLAVCAIRALRGSHGAAVVAAWTVGLLGVFVVTSPGYTLINVLIAALLAWAGVRLRRASGARRVRGAVRDPAVLVAGVGGLAASAAVLVGAGEWLLRYDIVSLDPLDVSFPLFAVAGTAPPALALAAAALGTLRGWSGWATAAVVLAVVVGVVAVSTTPEALPVSVPLTVLLLVLTMIARARIRRLADEQENRSTPDRGSGPADGSAPGTPPPPA